MANTPNEAMASFISKRLHELQDRKNQKEIADRAGYTHPNMITHLKNGSAKLSLDRVPDLAAALEVDPKLLLRMAILQYVSDEQRSAIAGLLETVVTDNEMSIVRFLREKTGGEDTPLNDRLRNALTAALAE